MGPPPHKIVVLGPWRGSGRDWRGGAIADMSAQHAFDSGQSSLVHDRRRRSSSWANTVGTYPRLDAGRRVRASVLAGMSMGKFVAECRELRVENLDEALGKKRVDGRLKEDFQRIAELRKLFWMKGKLDSAGGTRGKGPVRDPEIRWGSRSEG